MSAELDLVEEAKLLSELHRALAAAPQRVREIEVGIPMSIALGRQRPVLSCGGCSTPLSYGGIPARTNARLKEPFRLLLDEDAPA